MFKQLRKLFSKHKRQPSSEKEGLLWVADFIENNPTKYNFLTITIPTSTRDQGCLLGWYGYYIGERFGTVENVARKLGYWDQIHFYEDLRNYEEQSLSMRKTYQKDSGVAARALRKLARKKFP